VVFHLFLLVLEGYGEEVALDDGEEDPETAEGKREKSDASGFDFSPSSCWFTEEI